MVCSSIDSHARVRIIVAYVNLVFLAQLVFCVVTNVDLVDSSTTRHVFLFWIQIALLCCLLGIGFIISFCADGFRVCLFIYSLLIGMLLFTQLILYVPTTIASQDELFKHGGTSRHASNFKHSYSGWFSELEDKNLTNPEGANCNSYKGWSNWLECCDLPSNARAKCCAQLKPDSTVKLTCPIKYYMFLIKLEIIGFIIFTALDIILFAAILKLLWTNIYFAPDPNKRQRVLSVSGY